MKIIDVQINKRNIDKEKEEKVLDLFKMPLPDNVRLHISDSALTKIKEAIEMTMNKFNLISFISSTRKDEDSAHCFCEFLHNNKIMKIEKYEDFETLFDMVDNRCFTFSCDSIYSGYVKASFIYVNGWTEFSFSTVRFKI